MEVIELRVVLVLLFLHFVGDFFLQNNWMALNKSKRFGLNQHMVAHIAVLSLFYLPLGVTFVLANAAAHWLTDAVTSQLTTYFWRREQRHWFFVVIGFDQFIHVSVLVALYVAVMS